RSYDWPVAAGRAFHLEECYQPGPSFGGGKCARCSRGKRFRRRLRQSPATARQSKRTAQHLRRGMEKVLWPWKNQFLAHRPGGRRAGDSKHAACQSTRSHHHLSKYLRRIETCILEKHTTDYFST